MSFESEDGTGKSEANSFASVSIADAYHNLRRNTAWGDKDNDAKEGALVVATDWICRKFASEWQGYPAFPEQALPWPRVGVINPATGNPYANPLYPSVVVQATCELALVALDMDLRGTIKIPERGSMIEDTTGPLTTKWAPVPASILASSPTFDFIGEILSSVTGAVTASGLNFRVGRG